MSNAMPGKPCFIYLSITTWKEAALGWTPVVDGTLQCTEGSSVGFLHAASIASDTRDRKKYIRSILIPCFSC
jgi:hypothetical protein